MKIKEFILDILFPRFCVNCGKEGNYLCEDCFFLIDVFNQLYCPYCRPQHISKTTCHSCKIKGKYLNGMYCATSYDNFIIKNLIRQLKYEPYVREIAKTLAFILLMHIINATEIKNLRNFSIIPVPLHKSKLKQRGFNQSEEIAKEISAVLKLPILNNILVKNKRTLAQAELEKEKREQNLLNAFIINNADAIKDQKILLIDDVYTTGSTIEEIAKLLKQNEAKEVWAMVIARS